MQKQASLPLALAADPEIAAVAGREPGQPLVTRVNRRLAQIAAATGAAVIYVIRSDGITVAASNAGSERSFLGRGLCFQALLSAGYDRRRRIAIRPGYGERPGRASTSRGGSTNPAAWWW